MEGDSDPILINDDRFSPAGILPPKSKADFVFILHSLSWLATNGTAAIVCFPRILYRGGAEQKIRKYIIDNNFIESIIDLPANLFFRTSISTSIMVLKKSKPNNKTLFIKASDKFKKANNSNRLEQEHIDSILETYKNRESVDYVAKLVDQKEIEEQDYTLSVST